MSASQEYGMIKRTETGININHDIRNELGYKRVQPGQFVIHLRSFQGGFAHSSVESITSPAYTVFDLPSYEEQKQIGAFCKNLDHLITLHQRKQKLLKNHYFYKDFHEKHENNNNKGEDTMRSLKLYHGSNVAVREPKLFPTARALDFGAGFYLTTSYEQAKKWAELMVKRRRTGVPTVSVYEVNEEQWSELSVLKFNAPNVEWLKFVSANRRNQHMEENWDVVVGPVANDNTMPVINLYLKGSYDEEEALKRLLPQKLKDQYAFKTEKAISKLQLCEVIMV